MVLPHRRFGKIDVLFVNAGVAKFVPIDQVSEEHYDEIFDINAKGAYLTIRRALPYLNDGASIIVNTSVVSHKGFPGVSVYSGTKAALRSFTRSLAAELAGRNIRGNAVALDRLRRPFFSETAFRKRSWTGSQTASFQRYRGSASENRKKWLLQSRFSLREMLPT